MGALVQWLGAEGLRDLAGEYLGSRPFARPSVAHGAVAHCSWEVLDKALGSDAADVLVVDHGRDTDDPRPRSLSELCALFLRGSGIAMRKAEQACPTVNALARSLAEDVPGEQRVIVFATPPEAHGFGWHFDPEDVFIVQTAGVKTYYMRANTVSRRPLEPGAPSFARLRSETSPVLACELRAGDFLYIPSGYWHVAYAHSAALSVSIGVLPSNRS